MKLKGITVDKKIEGGCKLTFICDDELSWVKIVPNSEEELYNADSIFIWPGSEVHLIYENNQGIGGIVNFIDYDQKIFKVNDTIVEEYTPIWGVGIIGNDNRPKIEKQEKDPYTEPITIEDIKNTLKSSKEIWD